MLKRRRFGPVVLGDGRKGCVILSTAWSAFFFNRAQNAVTFNPNGRLLRKVWSCGCFSATKRLLHPIDPLGRFLFNPAENAARFNLNGRWVPSLLRLLLIVVWMMPEATLVPQPLLPLPSPSAPLPSFLGSRWPASVAGSGSWCRSSEFSWSGPSRANWSSFSDPRWAESPIGSLLFSWRSSGLKIVLTAQKDGIFTQGNGEMVRFRGRIRFLLSFLRFLMERPVRSKVQLLFWSQLHFHVSSSTFHSGDSGACVNLLKTRPLARDDEAEHHWGWTQWSWQEKEKGQRDVEEADWRIFAEISANSNPRWHLSNNSWLCSWLPSEM